MLVCRPAFAVLVTSYALDAAFLALDSRATTAIERRSAACALAQHACGVRVEPRELLSRDAERNALWELPSRLRLPQPCR